MKDDAPLAATCKPIMATGRSISKAPWHGEGSTAAKSAGRSVENSRCLFMAGLYHDRRRVSIGELEGNGRYTRASTHAPSPCQGSAFPVAAAACISSIMLFTGMPWI